MRSIARTFLSACKASWQACSAKPQVRAWRKVRVERVEIIEMPALGRAEIMCSSAIIIEYTFNGQKITQQLVGIPHNLGASQPTYIDIDPLEPTCCKATIEHKANLKRLWVVSVSLIIVCGIVKIL